MKHKPITISSSHGDFKIDPATGKVLSRNLGGDCEGYEAITKFDVVEFRRYYKYLQVSQMPSDIDILDLGYWYKARKGPKHKYESACMYWRADVVKRRNGDYD